MTTPPRGGKPRKTGDSWGWTLNVAGRQVRRQGWATKTEAQTALDAYKAEVANPTPATKPALTLAQAFERYFAAKARKRSLELDRPLSAHLIAVFGADTPLRDITADRISAYQEQRLATKSRQTGAPLSAASVNRPLQLLRHLLRLALRRWRAIDAVPEIQLEKERPRERFLTAEEAGRLLNAARESKNTELADVVEMAIFTGLRQGDVLGLTWEMVDRAQGMLIVPREKDDKPIGVPLNAHTDAILARRRPRDVEPTGRIFRSANWDHYRAAWERATVRAKLDDVHFHDLRHTFGSWLAQAGRTGREIQGLLGHTSLAMTNKYMHLAPSHLRAASAALDNVLAPTRDSKEKATEAVFDRVRESVVA
jgi:integrase